MSVKQDMDSVFWTCLSEEPAAMFQGGTNLMSANEDVPVASDMPPLTAQDITSSEVANKKIRLAHGYDVFIRQSDLFEAERASKESWSILTRRLLDIYFDRMTLAMGRASLRGSNEDHKPLNQTIIGAIRDEDEMSDDAALFCATENAVPSLQELAATSLEDDEDENDDDEWKPQEKTSKRKKKQTRKSTKRPHLEEPQPRKAKQRATLAVAAELSKNGGDGSDSDEDTDEDFDPTEGTSQDGDEDFESDSDDDLLELEDEEEDEDDDEDMHVGVQSLGRKRDEKQQLKATAGGRSSRILQTREVRAAKASPVKSPDKVNTAGNKENIADQQRYPQGKSSPKTPRSKGQTPRGQTSKGQTSKGQITDGQTQDGQTIEGQTNEGQTNDGQTPKGQTLRGQAPRGQSPKGQTPKGQAPKGQTPKGQVPAAKTPTVGKKGKVHQEGKSFKQETQANQTKTKLKTGKKMERQATPKKLRLAGGVVIEDLAKGDGKAAKAGKMVHVYYSGRLASNGKQFDSCLSGKPFMFRMGRSEVIKGWDVGIAGMKIGGERRITVPASEGYGQKAVGPIPPNSTLVFNVTLKKVS